MAPEKLKSTHERHRRLGTVAALVVLGGTLLGFGYHLTRESEPQFGARPLTAWVMELDTSEGGRRPQAEAALRSIGSNAVPTLVQILSGRESLFLKPLMAMHPILPGLVWRQVYRLFRPYEAEHRREMAARALGVLGQEAEPAIPVLCRALRSPSMRVSMAAADALKRMGRPAVPLLIEAVRGTNIHAAHLAGTALASIGPEAAEAVPSLIRALQSPSREVAQGARLALVGIGPTALPLLAESIDDLPTASREAVIGIMAAIGSASYHGLLALVQVAKHPSANARVCAVTALGKTGPPTKRLVLAVNATLLDQDQGVRLCAIAALEALAPKTKALTNAIPNLRQLAQDESDEVRSAARHALDLIQQRATL